MRDLEWRNKSLKPHTDAISIFEKIKKESRLSDDELKRIGITVQVLDEAYRYCIASKLSKKVAMQTIYNLWKQKEQEAKPKLLASVQDMIFGRFYLVDNKVWKHDDSSAEITVEELRKMSFKEVKERMFPGKK